MEADDLSAMIILQTQQVLVLCDKIIRARLQRRGEADVVSGIGFYDPHISVNAGEVAGVLAQYGQCLGNVVVVQSKVL